MAQLSDDCFAFGGELMRASEALEILARRIQPVAAHESVNLAHARGRVLAADVVAGRDVPPHDNVAVDGYAVRFDDLNPTGETGLKVGPRVAAGEVLERAVEPGVAVRVFTGAMLPPGTDTVYMQEDCRVETAPGGGPEGSIVSLPPGLKRGANRRKAGEDVRAGSTILPRGRRLRAQDIGLAASVGVSALEVHRRLRVALFSTGDELREPGEATGPGAVFDANRYVLMALLGGLGAEVEDFGIVPDRLEAIERTLARAAGRVDAIVTSGGMSTGDEDHVRAAVTRLGSIHFWRLAIRPGRPVALGQVAGVPFIGLPGNPVAMMVTFLRFARPVLLKLGGATDIDPIFYRVCAGFTMTKKHGRREWVRARLSPGADGAPVATKFPRDGAGILTSLVESDGLVELDEETTEVEAGAMVDFLPFSEVAP